MNMILDTHCHTVPSGHAYSTVMDYVQEAVKKELQLIAITDHAPEMPGGPGWLHFENLKVIPRFMEGIEILRGVELNIMDEEGRVDLRESLLKKLQVVIASLHTPCYAPSTLEEHTRAVINTMHNPYIKVIGHLGDPRYPLDLEKVVKAAKETDTAIEINNASLNPHHARYGGEDEVFRLLVLCKEHEVPVILGSDAHFHPDLGVLNYALAVTEKSGIPSELVLNTDLALFKAFFHLD